MKLIVSSMAFAFLLATAVRAEETYDLKLKWSAQVGDRKVQSSKESQDMKMNIVVVANGAKVHEENRSDTKTTVFEEEVLKAEGGKVLEAKYTFKAASRLVEGKETDFAFKGKTVLGSRDGGVWEFTNEDGSEIDEEELVAIKDLLGKEDKKDDAPEIQDVMSPGKPVKVGESWDIDSKKFIAGMKDGEDTFDAEKSRGTMKLLSVEKRGEALYGKIEGEIELSAKAMGKLVFDKPMPFKFKISLDACLDGTQPGGTMTMEAELVGKRVAKMNGNDLEVDITMKMGGNMSAERAK